MTQLRQLNLTRMNLERYKQKITVRKLREVRKVLLSCQNAHARARIHYPDLLFLLAINHYTDKLIFTVDEKKSDPVIFTDKLADGHTFCDRFPITRSLCINFNFIFKDNAQGELCYQS